MNTIEEYVSHNLNYKAIVNKEGDAFEVNVYHWNEEELDSDGKPTWERIAGPFPVENLPAAEALAQTTLADLAGEAADLEVDESVNTVIESVLGHDEFNFLKVSNFSITHLPSEESEAFLPLTAHKILLCGEFYYVLSDNDRWWTGFLYDEGQIRCWKPFDSLAAALVSMK